MVAKSQKPEIIKIHSVIQEAVRKGKMKREKRSKIKITNNQIKI